MEKNITEIVYRKIYPESFDKLRAFGKLTFVNFNDSVETARSNLFDSLQRVTSFRNILRAESFD